ncbi:unnamed protein product, partial [Mycena citricolor]
MHVWHLQLGDVPNHWQEENRNIPRPVFLFRFPVQRVCHSDAAPAANHTPSRRTNQAET